MFEPFERRNDGDLAVNHSLTWLDVLIDETIGGPGEVVLQCVGRELWKRADAHLHFVHGTHAVNDMIGGNSDEAGRKATLGNERSLGTLGELHDFLSDGNVLGQVKVVNASSLGVLGDHWVAEERCATHHGPLSGERLVNGGGVIEAPVHALSARS